MSHRIALRIAVGLVIAFALAAPATADAQLGRLRKIRNAISPDSAAKVAQAQADSVTMAAKRAVGDTTPIQRSRFSRGVQAAAAASAKFESVTGVSATDAALAATGVGAGAIVAKKVGSANAVRSAVQSGRSTAGAAAAAAAGGSAPGLSAVAGLAGASGLPAVPGATGMPNMADMARLQGEMMALQQEMVRLSVAAGAGDATAQGKIRRWEAIANKYKGEMERLAVAGSAGDAASLVRLQEIQTLMLREWAGAVIPSAKRGRP